MPSQPRSRLTSQDRRAALIEAALRCMSEGGIRAVTVDRVSARAQASRGLISHHFGSMSGLLTAVYTRIYAASTPRLADLPKDRPQILSLLDAYFAPQIFNREALNVWLTLWAEIANSPDLRAEHRAQYGLYHATIAQALTAAAAAPIDAARLATSLICLLDGLGLHHCIDPDAMPATKARQACLDLLTPHLGHLE